MASSVDDVLMNASLQWTAGGGGGGGGGDTFSLATPTSQSSAPYPTHALNRTFPEGCLEIRFSQMEFLPWNNPDNIVTPEVLARARTARFALLLVMFVVGGPANVINMAVFFRQGLGERVTLCLFSLSLADGCFLLATMLQYGEEVYLDFTRGASAGSLLKFVVNHHLMGLHAFCYVSFVLSAVLACERCYCVLRPLRYQTLMRTRTMALIIVAVYVAVLGLYFVVVLRYYFVCAHDPELGVVTNLLSHSEFYLSHKELVDYLDSFVFGAGLPVGTALVVVTATAVTTSRLRQARAWRSESSSFASSSSSSSSSSISPREVALTKMLVGTSVILIICISPACLFRLASLFLPELNTGRRHQNLYLTCLWTSEACLFVNSTLNIFVYYGMGTRYRETFWTLFSRGKK